MSIFKEKIGYNVLIKIRFLKKEKPIFNCFENRVSTIANYCVGIVYLAILGKNKKSYRCICFFFIEMAVYTFSNPYSDASWAGGDSWGMSICAPASIRRRAARSFPLRIA